MKELRSFGWSVGIAFLLLAAIFWWRGHTVVRDVIGAFGAALVILGTVYPAALTEIHAGWLRMAHALGWFNTRLILSIFYFLVITPVGVVMRAFGRDPLNRKWSAEQSSYWIKREEQRSPDHFEHQF